MCGCGERRGALPCGVGVASERGVARGSGGSHGTRPLLPPVLAGGFRERLRPALDARDSPTTRRRPLHPEAVCKNKLNLILKQNLPLIEISLQQYFTSTLNSRYISTSRYSTQIKVL